METIDLNNQIQNEILLSKQKSKKNQKKKTMYQRKVIIKLMR